jgi:hypothetical protein
MQPNSRLPQKVAACELLTCLGERLREAAEHVVPAYQVYYLRSLIYLD